MMMLLFAQCYMAIESIPSYSMVTYNPSMQGVVEMVDGYWHLENTYECRYDGVFLRAVVIDDILMWRQNE